MQYISKLPWPRLTDEQSQLLIWEFDKNKQHSKKVTKSSGQNLAQANYVENSRGYFNLSQWPDKLNAIQNILASPAINSNNIGQIGIQCSLGELPPHTDFARTVTAICVLEGPADTVFYRAEDSALGQLFTKSTLEEMQRVRLELNTWYLFNNAAIHGVDNYSHRRISLSLDLTSKFNNYSSALEQLAHSTELFL